MTESRWLIQAVCSSGSPSPSAPRRPERGLAELGGARALDAAAELLRHQLHAVADAEHRDAELVDRRIDLRRAVGVDRRRAAAEDQRGRVPRAQRRRRRPVADELRVDPGLAHTTRDQLRVLAAEIDDEDGPVLRSAAPEPGSANDLSADSWAPPS